MFNIGTQNEATAQTGDKKKAGGNIEDLAEERLTDTLAIKDSKRDAKRERDNYAQSLRKQKRDEELQKRRKGFAPSGQAATPSTVNGVATTNAEEQVDKSQLETIEKALAFKQTCGLSLEKFINIVGLHMQFTRDQFNQVTQMLYSEDTDTKLFALVGMRKILSIENKPPIQEVIDANLIKLFLVLLHHEIPKFQFEAAWCLTNVASGTTDHVNCLIEKDVLKHFIELLKSKHVEVVEQVIWGIGNIAGDNPQTRDQVIDSGVLEPMAGIIDLAPPDTSFMRNASWALSNLCRGRPQPQYLKVRRAVQTLGRVLVMNNNEEILTDVCWALSYLSDGAKQYIDDFLDPQLLMKLIQLMSNQNVALSIPCLRTLGNIVTGNDHQTQMAIEAGLVNVLHQNLSHSKKTIRKETCWVLSNVTAGTQDQIQACIDIGIIDKLVDILMHDEINVQNEAVWALSNTTSQASPVQVNQLVDKGIIKALGNILKANNSRMIAVALEGLMNIFDFGAEHFKTEDGENRFTLIAEESGVIDYLEELQSHQNHSIYQQALNIIDKHFNAEDEDNEMMQVINQAQNNENQEAQKSSAGLFDI